MKTSEFLTLLQNHKDKSLLFEYQPGQLVSANYHITEVKNTSIESVDCGAGTDAWNETIIQLWESPEELGKTEFMSAFKALGILNKVDKMRAMDRHAEVKFEYSNDQFHTAQLFVDDYTWNNEKLVLKLAIKKTDCKAKETCGIPVEVESEGSCCSPESGCC
jgi:hypothetical protein